MNETMNPPRCPSLAELRAFVVGNLGDSVNISQVGDGKIEIVTHIPFSGRYLKYL